MIIYYTFYVMMLIGYLGVSLGSPTFKLKLIGLLLLLVNALVFYK